MSPIFLGAAADSKEGLLESGGRGARRDSARNEKMIVTDLEEEGAGRATDRIRQQKTDESDAGGKFLQGGEPFFQFLVKQSEIDGF
jgi:hypothetical protein